MFPSDFYPSGGIIRTWNYWRSLCVQAQWQGDNSGVARNSGKKFRALRPQQLLGQPSPTWTSPAPSGPSWASQHGTSQTFGTSLGRSSGISAAFPLWSQHQAQIKDFCNQLSGEAEVQHLPTLVCQRPGSSCLPSRRKTGSDSTRTEKRAHRVIFPDSSRNRRKIPSLPDISRLNPTLCLSSLLLFSWHHLGAQHRHSQGFFLVHLPLLTQIPPAPLTATLWENPADSPELVRIQLLCKAGASTGWFGLGGPSPWNGNFHCSAYQKKGLIASPTKVGL